MDRESFWFRVLSVRYGVEGGMLKEGGRGASTWWCELAALHREGWFGDHVSRYEEGNGKNIFFR